LRQLDFVIRVGSFTIIAGFINNLRLDCIAKTSSSLARSDRQTSLILCSQMDAAEFVLGLDMVAERQKI
jgi:hypothetical protein